MLDFEFVERHRIKFMIGFLTSISINQEINPALCCVHSLQSQFFSKSMRFFQFVFFTFGALLFGLNQLSAETGRYRLIWVSDPSSSVVVGWERVSGEGGKVAYRPAGDEDAEFQYQSITRSVDYHDMINCFVVLDGLQADKLYDFYIEDSDGKSSNFNFLTAPAESKSFAFCAGGDSRNHREPRQAANRTVAKLSPLFVAFTGDMIGRDNPEEWKEWLDDWQLTITRSGRMIPILPHRGNHESNGNQTLYHLFNITPDNYYAVSVGGDLFRYYVLNSEMPCGGNQKEWLSMDLQLHSGTTRHLTAGYHKPMRPVVRSKEEGNDEYLQWAGLFYDHGMDLVFESDSHAIKRTYPIRPSTGEDSSEGFIAAIGDTKATVYTGEGCWGAPLRSANDLKPWIMAADSFNGIDWIHVYLDRMELRTLRVDAEEVMQSNSAGESLNIPDGIPLWNPESGSMVVIPGDIATGAVQ